MTKSLNYAEYLYVNLTQDLKMDAKHLKLVKVSRTDLRWYANDTDYSYDRFEGKIDLKSIQSVQKYSTDRDQPSLILSASLHTNFKGQELKQREIFLSFK